MLHPFIITISRLLPICLPLCLLLSATHPLHAQTAAPGVAAPQVAPQQVPGTTTLPAAPAAQNSPAQPNTVTANTNQPSAVPANAAQNAPQNAAVASPNQPAVVNPQNPAATAPIIPMKNELPHYFSYDLENPFPQTINTDVCIYGASACGVIAAIQLRNLGKEVVVVEPGDHLGGLTSGGLSFTDIGNKAAIGGLSREFYRRVGQHYGEEEEWRFEPHVAEQVFKEWVEQSDILVLYRNFLQHVEKTGNRITQIQTRGGATIKAKIFIDASYEGDLMAQAGITYRQGRESNYEYGETLNGMQIRDKHQFDFPVDPFVIEGDSDSGLLPTVKPTPPGAPGQGDMSVQAYNFRLCLSRNADTKMPFPKPENYDPKQYELLARYLKTGWGDQIFAGWGMLVNDKADLNNSGAVSSDYIGMNHYYPTASYSQREQIFQEHLSYQQGWLWFLANDPSVPERIRNRVNNWGLARDEFTETGGWPHQLYIREARRIVSPYVMTEHNVRGQQVADDPIGLAAYTMDSHNCNRFLLNGRVWNEGDVQVGGFPPYPISYRCITPKQNECENLLVPVCLGSTHIAYGSIRMEPVFMILGQSAGLAASLSIDHNTPVQALPYPELRHALEETHQILEWKK
ncbi:MAG: FAD-dependent oxidoreductase [Abitibacteriaceae bacterium]|nr:FAD-dependent oxidoreductase [Abditibacteriaceae bacterium]